MQPLAGRNPSRGLSPSFAWFWMTAFAAVLYALPEVAHAHVKWFAQFDLLCPPRSPWRVLSSSQFIMMSAFVVPLMYGVSWTDQRLSNASVWRAMGWGPLVERLAGFSARIGERAPAIIRIAVGIFFFALFCYGEFLITPELKTDAPWVRWTQLAMAVLLIASPRTAWLGALGIPVLFAAAVAKYGLFHMLDYPIFLGIATYIFLWSVFGKTKAVLADAILRSFTAVTLLWASIEKWAYPEWSFALLERHPELTFGFSPEFYMISAGFVEFCAAYLLITGRFASRAAAVVLLVFFFSAIIPFGLIDAVGHSGIMVVLIVLALGNDNVSAHVIDLQKPRATALMHTAIFVSVLVLLGAAYYGLHRVSFGY
jgi:hypothetical protein